MSPENSALSEQILAGENMNLAWEQVQANRGAPGIDQVTLARWGRNWEENIERLRQQVRTNTYQPNRPKRFYIAKKGGGMRELARLTVSDKVMQRAVLNVIDPLFDRRFLGCSHGYRTNRSTATAIQQLLSYRDQGLVYVFDADIAGCFDNLDHQLLTALIRRVISDWFVLNLTDLWLKAGRKHRHQAVGVPMGAVLSPLWCNIYLHQLDAGLTCQGWKMVRYADDFVVMAPTLEGARLAWQVTEAALNRLKLKLSPQKTRLGSFEQGFTFLGVTFQGDTYSYDCQHKHIQVEGRRLRWLYRNPPDFY
jgi:group II intron reverse transcriptase/maturase